MIKSKGLIISTEYPPLPGGIGNHAFHLASSLQKQSIEMFVLTNQRAADELENDFDQKSSVQVYRIKRRKLNFVTYLSRIVVLMKLIFRNHFDFILLSGQFSVMMVPWIRSIKPSIKIISIAHGSEILMGNLIKKKLTSIGFKKSHHVVCVSSYTAKVLESATGITCSTIIPNGFHTSSKIEKIRNSVNSKSLNLVTIGNISHRKGQLNVVRALPTILKEFPGTVYHMVGIPSIAEEVLATARQLKVIDHIKIHGILDDIQKNQILLNSSIFVMLSNSLSNGDFEGFGIAILEANSFGIPAIGSLNSGITDAIYEGYSGYCIHPEDKDALVISLKKIVQSYSEFSKNAIEWSKKFHWDNIIPEYEKLLK